MTDSERVDKTLIKKEEESKKVDEEDDDLFEDDEEDNDDAEEDEVEENVNGDKEGAVVSEDSGESGELIGDEKKLPFPRATITKLVRKNITPGKQIKGTVKDEMNLWVAKMIERIADKMNSKPYTFVNYEMLKESIGPYENIQGINQEREELITTIHKIKGECDSVINKIEDSAKLKVGPLTTTEEKLPFPRATITRKLRTHLDDGKTIKGPVKKGLNIWLGAVVERVAKKMDSYPYAYVDRSMFKDAIESYEAVGEIEMEKMRIIQQMESMKTICDLLIIEIDRRFKI